jgi:hypothetical protein
MREPHVCLVCEHPDRVEIERELRAGLPLSQVCAGRNFCSATLYRHHRSMCGSCARKKKSPPERPIIGVCGPHLARAARFVPARFAVDNELFCGPCFRGEPIFEPLEETGRHYIDATAPAPGARTNPSRLRVRQHWFLRVARGPRPQRAESQ